MPFITPSQITGLNISWNTNVDLSGKIPAGATGVIIEVINSSEYMVQIRNSTSSDDWHTKCDTEATSHVILMCGCAGRLIDIYLENTSPQLYVIGYTTSEVWRDNAQDVSPVLTVATWTDVDVSSYVPAGTKGVILEVYNNSSNQDRDYGIRPVGSSHDIHTMELEEKSHTAFLVKLDANRKFQAWIQSIEVIIMLLGYTPGSPSGADYIEYFVDPENRAISDPSTADSWETDDANTYGVPADGTGIFVEVTQSTESDAAIRHPDWSDIWGSNKEIGGGCHLFCGCGLNASDVFEYYQEDTSTDAYIFAYFVSGVTQVKDTISGVARIFGVVKDTISGLSRVKEINIKDTISGFATLLESVSTTIGGFARIKGVVKDTIDGAARILGQVKSTVSGLARVKGTNIKNTISGLARILEQIKTTIGGAARIKAAIKDTISGIATIVIKVKDTISGIARIKEVDIKDTISGISRIEEVIKDTISGLARVKDAVKTTISGITKIIIVVKDTISGLSRIKEVDIKNTINGFANVAGISVVKTTISGLAKIIIVVKDTISGQAKIVDRIKSTIGGIAKIVGTNKSIISGLARIKVSIKSTMSGLATIIVVVKDTISGLARIKEVNIKDTISGSSKILEVIKTTKGGLARVKDVLKSTISGSSRILEELKDTISGLARVKGSIKDVISGLARIKGTDIKSTISGLVRVKLTNIKNTLSGSSRILEIIKSTKNGISRVKGVLKDTIGGIAKIVEYGMVKTTIGGFAHIIGNIKGTFQFGTSADGSFQVSSEDVEGSIDFDRGVEGNINLEAI